MYLVLCGFVLNYSSRHRQMVAAATAFPLLSSATSCRAFDLRIHTIPQKNFPEPPGMPLLLRLKHKQATGAPLGGTPCSPQEIYATPQLFRNSRPPSYLLLGRQAGAPAGWVRAGGQECCRPQA